MVAETHPTDIELYEYVEDELPEERRAEIAAHLETCTGCAEQVELASAGRHALKGAGMLELPTERREEILRKLPAQESASAKRRGFFPKPLFAGIAALVAVAALAAVLVNNSNQNSAQESSAGAAAETTGDASSGGAEAAQARSSLHASGSADAIAEELQAKGFDAFVHKDRVVVRGATEQQVRAALADHGVGDVEVVVKNP